jgi:hypothetical protein
MRARIFILLCAALLIAGCGGGDDNSTSSQATTSPAVSVGTTGQTTVGGQPTKPAKPAKPPATAPVPSGNPGPPTAKVPNLVGQPLSTAQAVLARLGLAFRAESTKGDRTQIKSNWEVCETAPAAGHRAPVSSPVTLLTAAPGGC